MRLVVFIMLTVLFGCATQQKLPQRYMPLLAPSTLGAEISLQQRITVDREGKKQSFDAVLEVQNDNLTLIVMALNKRIYTLQLEGKQLTEHRDASAPQALQGQFIVEDLQMALWPLSTLQAQLAKGWTLNEVESARVLSEHSSPVLTINYAKESNRLGLIELENHRHNYRLRIESQAVQR